MREVDNHSLDAQKYLAYPIGQGPAQSVQALANQQYAHQIQTIKDELLLNPTPVQPHARARGMLLDRLGGVRGTMEIHRDNFLMCHVAKGMVYVFYLLGDDRSGVTKEDINIFPSDKLVASLRMVIMA